MSQSNNISMRTIEMREPGGPNVLHTGSRPIPTPNPGEVLVKVTAAGVNGPDLVQRRGHYPPPKGASDLMGLEVSGEIVEIGADVSNWNIGDKICALTNGGGYAEFVVIDAAHCLPIPEGVGEQDAAGLCETYFTVWNNIFYGREIAADSKFLVHGGAGGIGSTAVQLGAAFGWRVFTTCSEKAKDYCRQMGAEHAIDYRTEDFVEIVKEVGGADIILDIMGGDYVAKNFAAAAPDGHIAQLAFNKGSKVDINLMPIMLKRLTLTGSTLRPRTPAFKAAIAKDLKEKVWPMFKNGNLKVHTHATFSFDEAQSAHETLEAGGHHGKILLIP